MTLFAIPAEESFASTRIAGRLRRFLRRKSLGAQHHCDDCTAKRGAVKSGYHASTAFITAASVNSTLAAHEASARYTFATPQSRT